MGNKKKHRMQTLGRCLFLVVVVVLCAGVVAGQFPPATPNVQRCTIFSTDHDRTVEGISLSTASYFVKVGAQVVALHLEFTAFQANGLDSRYGAVTVLSRSGGIGASARPRLIAQDQYVVDVPLIGLSQPYHLYVSFKAKGQWRAIEPRNCQ